MTVQTPATYPPPPAALQDSSLVETYRRMTAGSARLAERAAARTPSSPRGLLPALHSALPRPSHLRRTP